MHTVDDHVCDRVRERAHMIVNPLAFALHGLGALLRTAVVEHRAINVCMQEPDKGRIRAETETDEYPGLRPRHPAS